MITFFLSIFSKIAAILTGTFVAVSSFFLPHPPELTPIESPVASSTISRTATTTLATTTTIHAPAPIKVTPKPVIPPVVRPPVPTPPPAPIPAPPVATSTPSVPIGTTTLAVGLVPLLSGGTARGGETVAISYLQVVNIGTQSAQLGGFTLKQNGSAPDTAIIGLVSIDDKGVTRGSVGGSESQTPFSQGAAFVPANVLFEPGQTRLFTIKAILSRNAPYSTTLKIDVTGMDSSATTKGKFPILGTTWTIAQ